MSEEKKIPFYGEWARTRERYLKAVKPAYWKELVETGEAESYLKEYEEDCQKMAEQMEERMLEREGITNQPKGMEWYEWATRMTAVHAQVREIMLAEIQS